MFMNPYAQFLQQESSISSPAVRNSTAMNPFEQYLQQQDKIRQDTLEKLNAKFRATDFSSVLKTPQAVNNNAAAAAGSSAADIGQNITSIGKDAIDAGKSIADTSKGVTGAGKTGPGAAGYASAALGAVNMFTGFKAMGDVADNINTTAPGLQTDAFGNPEYNLGNFANSVSAIRPQGVKGGEVLGGVASGASAGASVGGVWGAVIGGAIGGIGAAFGGHRRKRKMQEQKDKATRKLVRAQNRYNVAVEGAADNRQALANYQESMNNQNRMYNLFNIQPNLGI